MSPAVDRIVRALSLVLGLLSIAAGLWAMVAPHGFYANAAAYPPYNRHFIHDIGAFQIGLGSAIAAGLLLGDALLAVLAGNTIAAVAHFAGHLVDRSLGGGANDPLIFGVLALVFALLTLGRAGSLRAGRAAGARARRH